MQLACHNNNLLVRIVLLTLQYFSLFFNLALQQTKTPIFLFFLKKQLIFAFDFLTSLFVVGTIQTCSVKPVHK